MIKKFQNLLQKFPLLNFLGNKYYLTLVAFVIWMLFFDNYSYFEHRFLNQQIDELNDNKKYYLSLIHI